MLCCEKPHVAWAIIGFRVAPIEKIPASKRPLTSGEVY